MSFELLSEPIRKYVRDKRWEELRPIQNAAVSRILTTDENYVLASATASGKTEAAFLPILSKVDFGETGVQVLYISPLIALINDQFYRVEELCKRLDVTVTKWHGEASKSLKDKIVKQPNGIVLITPESLEAMFVNKPYNVKQLFSNLKFVVIDEIHSFVGTDRGTHLKSILSRLQNVNSAPFRIVGLSATIGDYEEAKNFTGDAARTKILLDRAAREIEARFRYFKAETQDLPLALLKDLYLAVKDRKTLIFPNSRGRTEEIAVKLKKISERVGGHPNYFSHHSSVHREVREYVEHFAKNTAHENFSICCTSTLELGIDIGAVDATAQIDATHSVASLVQRVGRSGRRAGETGKLLLYATDGWSLLQSIACWELYREGFIDPPQAVTKPYDILLHQTLSLVKERSGIAHRNLIAELKNNFAFRQIEIAEIEEIVEHLIKIDFLEKLWREVIIGIEGEKLVNRRDFYSIFKTEENFKVVSAGNTIGEIEYSPQIKENENIFLAARVWRIKSVDFDSKKIEVIGAKDGKKPKFSGGGVVIHPKIREKMLEILFSRNVFDYLDQPGADELEKMRKDFSIFDIRDVKFDRPLLVKENGLELFTFAGTKINRTINFLMNITGIKNSLDDDCSRFEIEAAKQDFLEKQRFLVQPVMEINNRIENLLRTTPAVLDFSKWASYLPLEYQTEILKEKYFDFENAKQMLGVCRIVENE